jgi:LacI family transcriptional regulator
MDAKRSKVTIDDVAREAGVAKSTVSRIINNAPGVKPVTKMKVNKVIEAMGFTPNLMARSLKTKLRRQIALAIDDIRNPYYPELAWAAEQIAKQNDFRLVLINHYGNPSDELDVIKEANDMHVDGIVLLSISHPKTLAAAIKKASVPICLIGNYGDEMPADTVSLTRSEGYLAMDHFLPVDPALIDSGERLSLQAGLEAARYFNSLEPRPDAVFAANDMVAIGVIQGLVELGVRVPEDVAVVGIDDITWCTLTNPKVSSVSNLVGEMGRIAVELLLKRIDSNSAMDGFQKVKLEPRLIVRESTVKSWQG